MNQALEIISLQHELAMAIGNDLDLNTTVSHFMRVCLKRFQLRGIHTFLKHSEDDKILPEEDSQKTQLKHFLSLPTRDQGEPWQQSEFLLNLVTVTSTDPAQSSVFENGRFFHLFDIPKRGVIIFESELAIPTEIISALYPLLQKFSSACAASHAYETLQNEVMSRRNAEEQVFHQANHDSLTQLSNRRKLNQVLTDVLSRRLTDAHIGALLFIDLNQFKSINDLMGHKVGDEILKIVGARLAKLQKPNDLVARFGGDEFVYLASDLGEASESAEQKIQSIATTIQDEISHVYTVDDACYTVGCSIGYETFPINCNNEIDIIRNADVAMYEAKKDKSKICIKYTKNMSHKLIDRMTYTRDLKNAITNKEFKLHYQPVVDAEGNIIAAEALLRWNRATFGPVSPAEYIPIAEESDLIFQIGDWVLYNVFKDARRLYEQGFPPHFQHFAINISGKELNRKGFVEKFKKLLHSVDIPPWIISIEITENTLINNINQAIETIGELRRLGVSSAIDDFGTGYSSLAYLKKLPVSTIKLDRAFVNNINNDSDNQSIARMVFALGENFNLDVVSEGIEREDELRCLLNLGFVRFQGFYFYRPAPFETLLNLLY